MDCSQPGSSVHGILQARIPEWVAMPFSRGSSWPRNQTQVSCGSYIEGRFFTTAILKWTTTRTYCIAHKTLLNVMWQSGWEGSFRENGYMYIYGWVPSLVLPETITTLLIGYTPIQNIKLKKKLIFLIYLITSLLPENWAGRKWEDESGQRFRADPGESKWWAGNTRAFQDKTKWRNYFANEAFIEGVNSL